MSIRSPEMLDRLEHHKLLSRKLDDYMYTLGVGSIVSMLLVTVGLFLLS